MLYLYEDETVKVWRSGPADPGGISSPRGVGWLCAQGPLCAQGSGLNVEHALQQAAAHRAEVHDTEPCRHCNGTGRVPRGQV